MDIDPTRARYGGFETGYESFYVKAHDPDSPRGFWIRYTVMRRRDAPPAGSLWVAMFDRNGPVALKAAEAVPNHDAPAWIAIGDATLGSTGLLGTATRDGVEAAWDLRFSSDEQPLYHLPRAWMYRAKLPRTKPISPMPLASFDGVVRIGDHALEARGWPGMLGHNWGAEHAERWIWLHAASFDGRSGSWLDVVLGRIKIGPATTPWIANGVLSLDGTRLRLGGIERARATKVRERVDGAEIELPAKGARARLVVAAPLQRSVGWRYGDPDGSEHHVINCSIAGMTVELSRDDGPAETLKVAHGATYELGMREQLHGVPLQPWGD